MEPTEEDQIVQYLTEKLGQPGFTADEIAFLIEHPEYEHRPVGIREFVTSPLYLDARLDCWPSVLSDLEKIFDQPVDSLKLSSFTEVVRKMGIGSGKSFRIVFAFCYVAYRLLCFKDPQRAYGQAQGVTIALVNAAVTAQQAKKIIFGDISERIKNSPWFAAHGQPDPNVRSELRFPKNIVIFPGSSSENAPLGYNIFMHCVDEAAFFQVTDARDSAQEVYDVGVTRRKSRFGDYGLNAAISSPSYVDSFIERKMDEAKSSKKISAADAPTWENKPRDIEAIARGDCFELAHPITGAAVKIPNVYKDDFAKNPKKAWRDFGAVASLALEPYFSDDELRRMEDAMARGRDVRAWAEANLVRGSVYHAHLDLGLVRDACGLAMGREERDKVYIELILRIVCRRRAAQLDRLQQRYDLVIGEEQVDFEQVREVIFSLARAGFAFGLVSFDQFQSVDSRQQLEKAGIRTTLVSVDRDTSAYDTLKSLINTDRFECVRHEHAMTEARRLELKNGKKVDHAQGASKDLMDPVAAVCKTLMEKYDEEGEVEETIYVDDEEPEVTPQI